MIGNYLREQDFLSKWSQGRNCLFICWKNVTSSRIPGAESGGGTLTAFRLLKESVRPADFPTRPTGSPGRGPGVQRTGDSQPRPLQVGPAGRPPRQGGSLVHTVWTGGLGTARQRSFKGQRLGSRPRRRAADPAAWGSPSSSRGSPQGPAPSGGGGDEPGAPSPPRAGGTC